MKKFELRNNNGMSFIKLILLILVTILVVFLAYEMIYVDLFDMIIVPQDSPIDIDKFADSNNANIRNEKYDNQNTEKIMSITEQKYYQISEQSNINHYYFNQLNNEAKIIYKALEDNIDYMKLGNYKIEFKTQFNDVLNSPNGEQKLNIAFQSAWNAFTYDYVGIFYIDVTKLILTTRTTSIGSFSTHRVDLSNGDNDNYFTQEIKSANDLKEKENYLVNTRNKIVSQLQGYSPYEQIKHIHNWMIDHFKYDTTYKKKDIHNIYGAFANREVVCEGYARAFKYILDGLGIENVLVSGTATNSNQVTESHAWNYVKIEDKWYAIDVTWDDPIITGGGDLTKELRYQYFLKGSDEFFKNHREDGYLSKNSTKFIFPILERENYEI